MFGFFVKKEALRMEKLRQDIAAEVERHFVEITHCLTERIESIGATCAKNNEESTRSVTERLTLLEDLLQQTQRQERRRQMALESLLESQAQALQALERLELSPPLEALMALSENLALTHLAQPQTSESAIQRNKLEELLACFGLTLLAEVFVAFDPAQHEACQARCDPHRPEDVVLEVVRPGFLLRGKVLRFATVVVNRCADKEQGESGEECLHD